MSARTGHTSRASLVAAGALLAVGCLTMGCSSPAPTGTATAATPASLGASASQPAAAAATATPPPSPAAPDTPDALWQRACVLTPAQINAALSGFGADVGEGEPDTWHTPPITTECDYNSASDESPSLSIIRFEYGVRNDPGFLDRQVPASRQAAYEQQCKDGFGGPPDVTWDCLKVAGAPAVLESDHLNLAVFPAGDSYYDIGVLNVTSDGTDPALRAALLTLGKAVIKATQ